MTETNKLLQDEQTEFARELNEFLKETQEVNPAFELRSFSDKLKNQRFLLHGQAGQLLRDYQELEDQIEIQRKKIEKTNRAVTEEQL